MNCSLEKRIETFIKNANTKYDYKYDYSKANYINKLTKICIICPIHGEFWQKPSYHLTRNYGCRKCAVEIVTTKITKKLENFIFEANKFHKNKFDYSKSIYVNSYTPIEIICPKHNSFWQNPHAHLVNGCNACRTNDFNEFVIKANIKFNNKFNYSKSNYENYKKHILIVCPIHNDFFQTPYDHLDSLYGCKECYYRSDRPKKSFKDFVLQANRIHKNKYDYSKSIYLNDSSKIEIICSTHGSFWQSPNTHLQNHGCYKCSINVSLQESEWLNFLKIDKSIRNKTLKINNKIFYPDAYDSITNTIYEFYGDFWHGNPKIYNLKNINISNKKSFNELYNKTIEREFYIKSFGYKMITIWESEWKELKKNLKGK